jgi:hypothetical protein
MLRFGIACVRLWRQTEPSSTQFSLDRVSASDPQRSFRDGQIGQQQHDDQHRRVVQTMPEGCSGVTVIRSQAWEQPYMGGAALPQKNQAAFGSLILPSVGRIRPTYAFHKQELGQSGHFLV